MNLHAVPSRSSKLTAMALVGVAVGIWIQALSGAPQYPTIAPGPIVLVALAVVIALVDRWRWIPMTGTLLSALILTGAFATPWTANQLSHPEAVGVFAGTVIQMLALLVGLVAGIAATADSYQSRTSTLVCRIVGVIFVAMGLVVIVRGASVDQYHNLLHVATGLIALYFGFSGSFAGAKSFCLGSGAFYLALGALGMVLGDPSMNRMWYVGPLHLAVADHGFHLVLGTVLVASGLLTNDLGPERSGAGFGPSMASSRT
jgi:hypothetical protein